MGFFTKIAGFFAGGLGSLQWIAITAAVCLATGFGSGYWTKAKFDQANEVGQAREAIKQTVAGQKEARAIDNQIIKDQQQQSANFRAYQKGLTDGSSVVRPQPDLSDVAKYVPAECVAPVEKVATEAVLACPDPVLSRGAVRLHNDARTGRSADPAGYGNAEDRAASDIDLQGLSEADLQVVEQYHQLGRRHDALVDWVDQHLTQCSK